MNTLGYKFCLIRHIHLTSCQLTITSSSIWATFCREKASTTSRKQKMLSKSLSNPNTWIFYATRINFLTDKNVLLVIIPVLINKDVFCPSYNDLKFMVQNSNYFLTNINGFYCTANGSSPTYTYIPSFFNFLPTQVITEHWVGFSELYNRFSLVIYFIHSINNVCISILISQIIPLSLPALVHVFVLHICASISVLQIRSSIPFS